MELPNNIKNAFINDYNLIKIHKKILHIFIFCTKRMLLEMDHFSQARPVRGPLAFLNYGPNSGPWAGPGLGPRAQPGPCRALLGTLDRVNRGEIERLQKPI